MNVTCKWFLSALTFTIAEECGTGIAVVCLLPMMNTSIWLLPIIAIRCRSCCRTSSTSIATSFPSSTVSHRALNVTDAVVFPASNVTVSFVSKSETSIQNVPEKATLIVQNMH